MKSITAGGHLILDMGKRNKNTVTANSQAKTFPGAMYYPETKFKP